MDDENKQSEHDSQTEPAPAQISTRRSCLFCTRQFLPRRANQEYCSPRHRRRALQARQRLDLLFDRAEGTHRLSAPVILRKVQIDRARRAAAPARPEPYLLARAQVLEAELQLKRWSELLRQRKAELEQLPRPSVQVVFAELRPGQRITADPRATYCTVACTDGSLAILALGFVQRTEKGTTG